MIRKLKRGLYLLGLAVLFAFAAAEPAVAAHTHSYTAGPHYESTHKAGGHREYYSCYAWDGATRVTGNYSAMSGCSQCYPPAHTHSYTVGPHYESTHKAGGHREYYSCYAWDGATRVTGNYSTMSGCSQCYPPAHSCSPGSTQTDSAHPHARWYYACTVSSCTKGNYNKKVSAGANASWSWVNSGNPSGTHTASGHAQTQKCSLCSTTRTTYVPTLSGCTTCYPHTCTPGSAWTDSAHPHARWYYACTVSSCTKGNYNRKVSAGANTTWSWVNNGVPSSNHVSGQGHTQSQKCSYSGCTASNSYYVDLPGCAACSPPVSQVMENGIYYITNASSSKYLSVHGGWNYNQTNVYQMDGYQSTLTDEPYRGQYIRVKYDESNDAYRLSALSSMNGRDRVLDISRAGQSLSAGQNVQIYDRYTDDIAQLFEIISTGNGQYKIVPQNDTSLSLTANTGDGTAAGKSSTSTGNIYISSYSNANNQKWEFSRLYALEDKEDHYGDMKVGYPLPNSVKTVTSGWGRRNYGSGVHRGLDIAGATDTELYAPFDGKVLNVILSTSGNGMGNAVIIEADNLYVEGSPTQKIQVVYMHMNKHVAALNLGDSVLAGDLVGYMGNTGNSGGVHLHMGLVVNGTGAAYSSSTITDDPLMLYPDFEFTWSQ